MYDRTTTLGQSLVQYGPYNNRIYLMKLHADDLPGIANDLTDMAKQHGFTKIFAKIGSKLRHAFDAAGYIEEARVPGMVGGQGDALFLSLYLDAERGVEREPERVTQVLDIAHDKAHDELTGAAVDVEEATSDDTTEMSAVYDTIFASYPFPIHDPVYLAETMKSHIRYFCVRENGRIVAVSSAEMDTNAACVEMTDFATLPEARGHGLAVHLLAHMEQAMRIQGNMRTAYTIARAFSAGMNVTFARGGYAFAGTLTNNTNISGHIESMNVWHKPLTD